MPPLHMPMRIPIPLDLGPALLPELSLSNGLGVGAFDGEVGLRGEVRAAGAAV